MYRHGAGGEFLASQVYQYSTKFKNTSISSVTNKNNKTIADASDFHVALNSSSFKLLKTSDDLIQAITTNILKQKDPISLLDQTITTLDLLNNQGTKFLFRIHELPHEYFYNKTFLVYSIQNKWRDYWNKLYFIKGSYNLTALQALNSTGVKENYNSNLIKDLIEYCQENNIEEVNQNHFQDIIMYRLNKSQIEKLLKYPLSNTYDMKHINFLVSDSFLNSTTFDFDNYRTISYPRYFEKGYLEDKFEINSNEFHDNLIEWHEKNLQLLSKNGFDITEFKI
jgi:hypothetical protein